jgi:hypothetical protein
MAFPNGESSNNFTHANARTNCNRSSNRLIRSANYTVLDYDNAFACNLTCKSYNSIAGGQNLVATSSNQINSAMTR